MKILQRIVLFLIAFFSLVTFMAGCNYNSENSTIANGGDSLMTTHGLSGFSTLAQSLRATTKHSLVDITKITFFESYDMLTKNMVAINIADKNLFIAPHSFTYLDYETPDYEMTDKDVNVVLDILNRHDVLNWNNCYGSLADDSPDTMDDSSGWNLCIQYSDNTVNLYVGHGLRSEGLFPKGFELFVEEITTFTHSRQPNNG